MPVVETYTCESCGYDMGDDYTWCCDCCGDYWCSDCYTEHAECDCGDCDSCDQGTANLIVPDIDTATPGEIVASLRAVGVEYEADGGNVYDVRREIGHLLLTDHSEHCGHEFVSQPARGSSLEDTVHEITGTLRRHGWTEYEDCGLHFHIDMTQDFGPARARAIGALRLVEGFLYALTNGRETVSWCKQSAAGYRDDVPAMLADGYTMPEPWNLQSDRYIGINSQALAEHGTIEVRIMDAAAQAEPVRLLQAIALATAIVDYAVDAAPADLRAYIGDAAALVREVLPADLAAEIISAYEGQDDARRVRAERQAAQQSALQAARRAYDEDMRIIRDAYAEFQADIPRRTSAYDALRNAQVAEHAARRVAQEARRAYMAAERIEDAARSARYAAERALQVESSPLLAPGTDEFYALSDVLSRRYADAERAARMI